MEGTITISLKDFDNFRNKAEKLDRIEMLLNNELKGKIPTESQAVSLIDLIIEMFLPY